MSSDRRHWAQGHLRRIGSVVREIVELAVEKEIHFLAASIAYYTFAALIPLFLFAFVAISAIGGDELALQVVLMTQEFLTPTSQEFLRDAIGQTEGRTGVIFGASLVFAWSMFRLIRSLEIAISMVYETELSPPILAQISTAATLFFSILIAGSGLASISLFLTVLPGNPLVGLLTSGVVPVALVFVFWPIYYLLPAVDHSVVDALPGTIVASVSWLLLNLLVALYPVIAVRYQIYGLLGGVLLLLVWFYVSAMIIVFGAVINAVLYDASDGTDHASDSALSTR
ncbi:MAG: YihY/virulence factor BrkB family protein [Halovenus sp.]|uniref:YihY/virulence factor BrkB family protein n=1 Tax=Halovenus amylolytica TaxID=2500550 RepID=UPI000FE2DBB2